MTNITHTADYLSKALESLGFIIMSQTGGKGLPLIAFRLDPKIKFEHDEFAIAHELRQRGWVIPAYTMAPHSEKLKLMRIVVREDFSRSRGDALLKDIKLVLDELKMTDAKSHEHERKKQNKKQSKVPKNKLVANGDHKDDHSLQASDDKSHPIC